jgi:hypothetical protein
MKTCRVSCQNKIVKSVHLVSFIIKKFDTMHSHTKVKFVNAKQAKGTYQYRNTKEKLYKTNAAIWYNKICAVYKLVWHISLLSVQWINSWWWTEELSETCRISCQNKFVKLVHLVGFITKKSVTMHGHTNIKYTLLFPTTTQCLAFELLHFSAICWSHHQDGYCCQRF